VPPSTPSKAREKVSGNGPDTAFHAASRLGSYAMASYRGDPSAKKRARQPIPGTHAMGTIRRLLGFDPLAPPLEVVRKVGQIREACLDRSVDHDAQFNWLHAARPSAGVRGGRIMPVSV
jgi:hypothetical protein